jgi:uncharacterized membrane protein
VHAGREEESPRRLAAAAALAAVGAVVAGYLAAAQIGIIARVWDPVFGSASSHAVLHSRLSRALPVSDAALGAAGYLGELALALALIVERRGGARYWLGVAYGALAMAMALAGVGLVAIQAIFVRSFCSLCLLSAVISWAIAVLAFPSLAGGIRALASGAARRRTTT